MWKLLVIWVMLAVCMYTFVNWFLIPTFPIVYRNFQELSFVKAFGISSGFLIIGMLFGEK